MDNSKQTSLTSHFQPVPPKNINQQNVEDQFSPQTKPKINFIEDKVASRFIPKNIQKTKRNKQFPTHHSNTNPLYSKENSNNLTKQTVSECNTDNEGQVYPKPQQTQSLNFDKSKYREKPKEFPPKHYENLKQNHRTLSKKSNYDPRTNIRHGELQKFSTKPNAVTKNADFYNSKPSGSLHYSSNLEKNKNIVWSTKPMPIKPKMDSTINQYKPKIEQKYENSEIKAIKDALEKKEGLLRSVDLKKLPDGGKRLQDQINELKTKLKDLKLSQLNTPVEPANKPNEDRIKEVTSKFNVIDLTEESYQPNGSNYEQYYGGRMTAKRITTVAKVTSEAIESLHESLETCPTPATQLKDPKGLLVNLMVHQRQALAWMVWRERQLVSGGILADDMGLGKTLTMISLILKQRELQNEKKLKVEPVESENIKIENDEKKEQFSDEGENVAEKLSISGGTLIVAPASLIFHWECEINNRCEGNLLNVHLYHGSKREKNPEFLAEFDVVITTYNLVRSCHVKKNAETKSKTGEENSLFQIKWRRIILDESHQIKNYKSQTSVAACSLSAHSRWAMSGTPVQNDESDMFAMIKFLHCKPFNEFKLWKNQVSNKTTRGQQRLKTLVSCFVLRREKSQKGLDGKALVNLPSRTFETHRLQLSSVEQEVYDKLKSDSQAAFMKYEKNKQLHKTTSHYFDSKSEEKKFTSTTLLVMLLRLRQCCGHLSLLKNKFDTDLLEKEKKEIAVEDLLGSLSLTNNSCSFKADQVIEKDKLKYFEISSTSSKIKFVMDRLNILNFEKPDDKCVIISQWTSMLNVLSHHLRLANLSYSVIDGSVTAQKRMELVNLFNKEFLEPKIMLVSLQAGGVGLNLVGANHLFLLDMHWNPALEKQAFDRIYRVGQKKKVFVHKFVVEKTVEEQILKLQDRKLLIANSVMEGADRDNKVKLSLSDMKSLFGIN